MKTRWQAELKASWTRRRIATHKLARRNVATAMQPTYDCSSTTNVIQLVFALSISCLMQPVNSRARQTEELEDS